MYKRQTGNHANAQDEKIFQREVQRLELSLKQAEKLRQMGQPLVVMMHYPPFDEKRQPSPFTDLMERYGVSLATYGHLHGNHLKSVFEGTLRGVCLLYTSGPNRRTPVGRSMPRPSGLRPSITF